MNQKLERLLLLAAIIVGLSCAWLPLLDNEATKLVDRGLERSLITFASARTLSAILSVAQSASIGVVAIGQALHPINEVVGQFSDLMLAVCVAFGAMKLLIVIGGSKAILLPMSFVALWWSWFLWYRKAMPSLLSKTLIVLVLVRFSAPVIAVGSELVFQQLFAAQYETAQGGITDIAFISPAPANVAAGPVKGDAGILARFKAWWAAKIDVDGHVEYLKHSAERWVRYMVDLTALFILQTLVVPLLLFWMLYRFTLSMLNSRLIPETRPQ